jgi:uncharacterized UPF0146 family protein
MASHIALIKLERVNKNRIDITVVTDDVFGPPIKLYGSADIRNKQVTVEIR